MLEVDSKVARALSLQNAATLGPGIPVPIPKDAQNPPSLLSALAPYHIHRNPKRKAGLVFCDSTRTICDQGNVLFVCFVLFF